MASWSPVRGESQISRNTAIRSRYRLQGRVHETTVVTLVLESCNINIFPVCYGVRQPPIAQHPVSDSFVQLRTVSSTKAVRKLFKISYGPQTFGKSRYGSCPGDRDRCPEQFPAPPRFWEPYNRSLSPPISPTSFGTVSDSFVQFRTVSDSLVQNWKSAKNRRTPHQFRKAFRELNKKLVIRKLRPGRMYTMIYSAARTDRRILSN